METVNLSISKNYQESNRKQAAPSFQSDICIITYNIRAFAVLKFYSSIKGHFLDKKKAKTLIAYFCKYIVLLANCKHNAGVFYKDMIKS